MRNQQVKRIGTGRLEWFLWISYHAHELRRATYPTRADVPLDFLPSQSLPQFLYQLSLGYASVHLSKRAISRRFVDSRGAVCFVLG